METAADIIDSMDLHSLGVEITETDRGLALVGDGMELIADFSRMKPRLKPANLKRELLVQAARIKSVDRAPSVIDATAGFGEDALLLAAAGFTVTMFEHNPIIVALLRDALTRAGQDNLLASAVSRMNLIEGDSIQELENIASSPDVVYLDPMFPERSKSAAVKKKFQLLHRIELPCSDEDELLEAAFASKPRKIVIKRTLKGPYLAGRKPHYSLKGKAIRYDCFAFASENCIPNA
ncbi:MAG: class I SAM-dependent methyltransferase [Eggerthellaceae bacterium]|nr:class I SAM-dependent methyltransferase [Eggerthellaceae bacterium]